ncbi:hypothetical protein, partial [Aeromonas salmonicida]|uniref:hypothetical protein n=1 Tax=Aeromonas salmonicida TaxID=645 RepID=UPI00195E61B8
EIWGRGEQTNEKPPSNLSLITLHFVAIGHFAPCLKISGWQCKDEEKPLSILAAHSCHPR